MCRIAIIFMLSAAAAAQTATIAITQANITIDPTSTDTYDLQGSFTGLTLTAAQFVTLSIGNFAAAIPAASFVQQPNSNVFVYQDASGQTPYWVSTLTINLDAQTFEAQATGIVLAGLSNPFAVQLGTDQASACTMARVQQTDAGSYQLTPADPVGMTCELANLPIPYPNFVPIGAPTAVTLSTTAQTFGASDIPQNPQVFRADDDAQPIGDPLCVMSAETDGSYACTVSFNETNAGVIPLVVQATVAGQMVLSPGFSLQAVAPPTDQDSQQLQSVENAVAQTWQNFTKYGDTAYARILTMQSLRRLLQPDPTLTRHPIALSPNGLDISVQTDGGVLVNSVLNDLSDDLPQPGSSAALGRQMRTRTRTRNIALTAHRLESLRPAPAAQTAPTCGSPKRNVVWNNNVLIWDPSFFQGANWTDDVANMFKNSKCPNNFNVAPPIRGTAATPKSMQQFSNYGTVILNSHGAYDKYGFVDIITGVAGDSDLDYLTVRNSGLSKGCVDGVCYVAVLPWSSYLTPLHTNTIVYMGLCYGNQFLTQQTPRGLKAGWLSSGANVAFYNFRYSVFVVEDAQDAHAVFDQLINHGKNTGEAWGLAPQPSEPTIFLRNGDSSLAYTGNPTITSKSGKASRTGARLTSDTTTQQFGMNMNDSPMALEAQIDGATGDTCQVNYKWVNTANAGHVKSDTGGSGQDNFTSMDANILYTPLMPPNSLSLLTPYPGVDNLTADFILDPADGPWAEACGKMDVYVPMMVWEQRAVTYPAATPMVPALTVFLPPKPVTATYNLSDPGAYKGQGATATATLTGDGKTHWTLTVTATGGNPTANSPMPMPYESQVQIALYAYNPPATPGGAAHVRINGSFNTAFVCNAQNVCSISDGEILIGDGYGKATVISMRPEDHAANPFTVMADSSGGVVSIYAGVSCNPGLPTPTSYSATLDIQFLSQ